MVGTGSFVLAKHGKAGPLAREHGSRLGGFSSPEVRAVPRRFPRRIATVSVHTSPLEQPGTGDAGGLNVYVVEVAKRLAERGVEVDIFTRAVSRDVPPVARSEER